MRGRVLGADQRPVQTRVDLLPADSRTEVFPREGQLKLTNASGEFEFGVLPPGDYILGVNLKRPQSGPPYPPTYYPGTTNRADAQMIHVGEGSVQENVDLVLPRALAPGRVIVTSPPPPNGTVFACVVSVGTYRQPAPGEPIAVHVIEGVRYRLRLHVEDPAGKHWESELIDVEGKAGDHTAVIAGFHAARPHPENNECFNEAQGDAK